LPWCRASSVRDLGENEREASLEFSRAGLHRRFTTRNTLDPGRAIEVELVNGPFRVLEGSWSFRPLGETGSKVTLDLRFEFASHLLEAVFAPVFAELMNSLVDAFVDRARELHRVARA
ncbi:MAG: type II toxin-antitoxin system RatA family toxin, partial [Gammaproteobacteria bacterium]